MSNCGRCNGACRCEHEHEICLTLGGVNAECVPCCLDQKGCLVDDPASSRFEIWCPCCPIKIAEIPDVFGVSNCDGCTVTIDMTDLQTFLIAGLTVSDLKGMDCGLKYKLFVDNKPHMTGRLKLDFSFV